MGKSWCCPYRETDPQTSPSVSCSQIISRKDAIFFVGNSEFRYTIFFKKEDKNGKKFAKIDDDNLEWKIEKAHFKFDNLFNGNQLMGMYLLLLRAK